MGLAACAAVGPDYRVPATDTAASYPHADTLAARRKAARTRAG
ncbi:hypothetical protein ACU4GD_30910 [Cupriavidus basilensis]